MNTAPVRPSRLRRAVKAMFRLAAWSGLLLALAMAFLSVLPFVAPDFWFADNMSFFLPQLLTGGTLAICGAFVCRLIARRRLKGSVFAAFALIVVLGLVAGTALTSLRTASVLALGRSGPAIANGEHGTPFRVVSINLEMRYLGDTDFMDYLENLNADVLVFQETNWRQQLRYREKVRKETGPLPGTGPYPATFHVGDLGSVVVFSHHPVLSSENIRVDGVCGDGQWGQREILRMRLDVAGKPVTFIALHPESPRTPCRFEARQVYYAALGLELARLRRESTDPVILAGDWNMSPWSAHFSQLLQAGDLKTLFPSSIPVITRFFFDYRLSWFLGAAVDHIAVSPSIEISAVAVGPDVGSDHVPLIADLVLP
ncbi:endonuclease/exonuclease/phosphatase family protein [Pannonibacter carbonis]|uniref:endonuclease/exonuclease/phosphatase family protein n=1 Tax=Pannonibacter carbonis TaxID=2067569 RepID=UPI000D0FD543|nr:endonuclease/exonuclease/phosphatase family protein [Pannonibacter carbonis]